MFGLDSDTLTGSFVDGRPVDTDEMEMVLRSLVASRRFSAADLKRYSAASVPWAKLAESPIERRGELLTLTGRVVLAERLLLSDAQQEQYEMSEVFRCELELGEEARPATVFALRVPKAWPIGEPIKERISARAIFLKTSSEESDRVTPVLAAKRVAWHPDTVLGDLGYDVGLLDDVQNQTSLTAEDSEAFFSMLGTLGDATTGELLRHARKDLSVAALFPTSRQIGTTTKREDPKAARGELIALVGTVIRCIEIKLESSELREAYGFDHYYELEMANIESQGNPISVCVLKLPDGLREGTRLSIDVRMAGFFFKTWTYRQQRDPRSTTPVPEGKVKLRIAPLLIGREPVLLEPPSTGSPWMHLVVAGMFVALAAGAWLGVWWFNREDAAFSQRTIAKKFAPAEGKSLDDAGIEDHGPPDFSNLP